MNEAEIKAIVERQATLMADLACATKLLASIPSDHAALTAVIDGVADLYANHNELSQLLWPAGSN